MLWVIWEMLSGIWLLSTSGAAVIGELGSISSKTIATAVKMAAPYIKEMNAVLGDLANGITHL
ncbi:uncharacterized protein LOC117791212 isoform X2 [Drosophila innubila]|uniref:uncharacterized protein LOC117791212 isoform X2 n=1 Tax=Drosophila innubila TaxID=198719 RepID=UPI00148B62A7|nr:uncharacterized protein LOC117791212 isoform X2 [Drosophila innubila]